MKKKSSTSSSSSSSTSSTTIAASPSKSKTQQQQQDRAPPTEADYHLIVQSSNLPGRVVLFAATMKKLRIAVNDFVVVKHEACACSWVGRAWPTQKLTHKQIGLDRGACDCLQCGVGDTVVISKSELPFAERVTIRCVDVLEHSMSAATKDYVAMSTINMAMTKGETISFSVYGKNQSFAVEEMATRSSAATSENNTCIVTNETKVTVLGSQEPLPIRTTKGSSLQGESLGVGGMKEVVSKLNEILGMVLKNRSTLRQYGNTVPVGVLLYGPPGTGKTLLARSVAASLGLSLVILDAADVVGKYYGESEQKLREGFAAARENAPCILFIDEVDALCGDATDSDKSQDLRIVTATVAQLDALALANNNNNNNKDDEDKCVLVIAATNRPEALDPSLRRPGRLDHEIHVGVPNEQGRLEILRLHLQNTDHALTDDDIAALASRMHGYVGADIKAVVSEATMHCLRRNRHHENEDNEHAAEKSNFVLENGDFQQAITKIGPSALRETAVEVPKVYWDDIGGQEEAKQSLREAVEWPLKYPDAFERLGVRPPRGLLLYGPPGCSKTLMAKALATEANLNFLAVKGPELLRKWVGESEKAVRSLFQKARSASPAIVFFDEIDALAGTRGSGDSGAVERVVSQLLSELDGIEPLQNVVVVAATNRPDLIDPALLRPGRIDRKLYIAPPDLQSRAAIFRIHTRKMPCDDDVDIGMLAEKSSSMLLSGAEVANVCREAALVAMQENIGIDKVCMRHFEAALGSTRPGISPQMIEFYQQFQRTGRGK